MKRMLYFMLPFLPTGCSATDQSVGVIGGADGPTSIMVSSSLNPWGLGILIAAVIAVLVIWCLRKKRK